MFGQFMRHLPVIPRDDHVEREGRYLWRARGCIRQQGFKDQHVCTLRSKGWLGGKD
jgi:hypothetical protein